MVTNAKRLFYITGLLILNCFLVQQVYAKYDTLGVYVENGETVFSIWSPDSDKVAVSIESSPGKGDFKSYPLKYNGVIVDDYGNEYTEVYTTTVDENLNLCRYNFTINGKAVRDPYGRMAVDNKTIGTVSGWQKAFCVQPYNVVIDLSKVMQNDDFANISGSYYKNKTDAIIYETHIVDLTYNSAASKGDVEFKNSFKQYLNSENIINKLNGTFLGMAQSGTTVDEYSTGVDSLADLGITHVHILPFANFSFCGANYDFGYDPMDYNIPQINYSALKQPSSPKEYNNYIGRIIEVQQMVNNFHKKGIRVIRDVVYNHTVTNKVFNNITSQYYGNSIGGYATLNPYNPMVNNLIRDSLEYWLVVYNLDGFRFDMMQVYPPDIPSMNGLFLKKWMKFLYTNFPKKNLLVYGEYFNLPNNDPDYEAGMGVISLSEPTVNGKLMPGTGGFNWTYKQSLIGSPMSEIPGYGYIFNMLNGADATMQHISQGAKGSIRASFSNPPVRLQNLGDPQFANFPSEAINYVDCHDGYCLWDAISAWSIKSSASLSYKKQIDKFAIAILMTSQGIPFFAEGDEFLRSKDPYDYKAASQSDFKRDMNVLFWDQKNDNINTFNYYKKVINLRKQHPAFRLSTWQDINSRIKTYYSPQKNMQNDVLVTLIDGTDIPGESWLNIILIYNSGSDYNYTIPDGTSYKIALDISDATNKDYKPNTKKVYDPGDNVVCGGSSVTILYSVDEEI